MHNQAEPDVTPSIDHDNGAIGEGLVPAVLLGTLGRASMFVCTSVADHTAFA